jgi:hypothetical protein
VRRIAASPCCKFPIGGIVIPPTSEYQSKGITLSHSQMGRGHALLHDLSFLIFPDLQGKRIHRQRNEV